MDPPGTGKESISDTLERMLVCRSSKFTVGRKSNEPDGGLELRFAGVVVDAILYRCPLLVEVCRTGVSLGVLP